MAVRKKRMYRWLTIGSFLMLGLLMLASVSVYFAPRFGWRVDGLRTGSMSPILNAGDLVVTIPVEPRAVSVGDIIVFRAPGKPNNFISHRVIGIQENSPLSFTTKGDANEAADPFTTPARDVVGIVDFHFPLLGYLVLFLNTKLGIVTALVVPGIIIAFACLRGIYSELGRMKTSVL